MPVARQGTRVIDLPMVRGPQGREGPKMVERRNATGGRVIFKVLFLLLKTFGPLQPFVPHMQGDL